MKIKPHKRVARQEEAIVTEGRVEIPPTVEQRTVTGAGAGAVLPPKRGFEPEIEPSPPIDLPTEGIGKSKLIIIGLGVVLLILFLKKG